jgi:hypothetical protein
MLRRPAAVPERVASVNRPPGSWGFFGRIRARNARQHALHGARHRSLGKTIPLNDDDLADFVALHPKWADSPKSWTVDASDLDRTTWDLSVKNPNAPEEAPLRSPKEIIEAMLARDAETAQILEDIRGVL